MTVFPSLVLVLAALLSFPVETLGLLASGAYDQSNSINTRGSILRLGWTVSERSHIRLSAISEASSTPLEEEVSDCVADLAEYASVGQLDRDLCQMSPDRAEALLHKCWYVFNATGDESWLPTQATYTSVITAWARSNQKKRAAERAEELLEEMEFLHHTYPHLEPTTACVNAVL